MDFDDCLSPDSLEGITTSKNVGHHQPRQAPFTPSTSLERPRRSPAAKLAAAAATQRCLVWTWLLPIIIEEDASEASVAAAAAGARSHTSGHAVALSAAAPCKAEYHMRSSRDARLRVRLPGDDAGASLGSGDGEECADRPSSSSSLNDLPPYSPFSSISSSEGSLSSPESITLGGSSGSLGSSSGCLGGGLKFS